MNNKTRCFIAANGPGLNNIDMSKLKNEVVFGLNRGYLKRDMPIKYLVVVNDLVEKQFGKEILLAGYEKIYSNSLVGNNVSRLKWTPDIPTFQKNPSVYPMWQGHTVTFVAMQLAFEMGFETVYVIGLDHSYSYNATETKKGIRGMISTGPDTNHFSPDYFGKGVQWEAANLTMSEKAFSLANQAYKESGRSLLNASNPTKLSSDIIKTVDFNSIWDNK